jgi:hypothetical protein
MSHMEFRHFISDSLTFAFLIPTWRLAGAFSSSLTTHGIQPAQHEAVWSLPPQGDSEGPNLHQLHSTAITPGPPTQPSLQRSWHTNFYKLARCTERRQIVADFYIALANTIVLVRRLLRRAWSLYRWDTRPRRRP